MCFGEFEDLASRMSRFNVGAHGCRWSIPFAYYLFSLLELAFFSSRSVPLTYLFVRSSETAPQILLGINDKPRSFAKVLLE